MAMKAEVEKNKLYRLDILHIVIKTNLNNKLVCGDKLPIRLLI